MKPLHTALVLVGAMAMVGCKPDGSDLNKTLQFYYATGKKSLPSGHDTYHLLSAKSREQITEDHWASLKEKDTNSDSFEVLRQEEREGITYALVSIVETSKDGRETYTNTWAQENGKWRRLKFLKTYEECERAFSNGDYPTSIAKAEEYLSMDPFCISAYQLLGFSMIRGGQRGAGSRSLDDVVRAVLAINPKDSQANFLAVSWTDDPNVAKSFLRRLEGTIFYRGSAFNLSEKIRSLPDRIKFLEESGNDPSLLMLKFEALAQLGRWEECRVQLSNPGLETSTREMLRDKDPTFAASHAAKLGLVSLAYGDGASARRWLDVAIGRDPNDAQVKKLSDALESSAPMEFARAYWISVGSRS